ncbi:RNA methyltransferase [bacterium]|nr:RNA methyltransferase [bacterium]
MKPLKWYQHLSSVKARREEVCFLVEGQRAIAQIHETAPDALQEVLCLEDEQGRFPQIPERIITRQQLRQITSLATPQGIAAVVTLPGDVYSDHLPDDPGDLLLFLDDVQDPGNVGTIIRTAAAFGFPGVIMSDGCADPFSIKTVQASAGSILSLWLRKTSSGPALLAGLREDGYALAGLDAGAAISLTALKPTGKRVLCLGNEGHGLHAEVSVMVDEMVRIPIARQRAESLNVSVSAAIAMYHAVQQRIDLEHNF